MINSILRYGFIFVLLMVLQILLFNNIQFSGYVNPYVYVMFILLLPYNIPAWLLLIVSFLTGMTMDFFTGSPGMHASATLLAGFTRPYVLRLISPRDGYEAVSDLSMLALGFRWFLIYTVFIVLIHHIFLFYIEVFRLSEFFRTLLRVMLSSVFTIIFILLAEFYRKGR